MGDAGAKRGKGKGRGSAEQAAEVCFWDGAGDLPECPAPGEERCYVVRDCMSYQWGHDNADSGGSTDGEEAMWANVAFRANDGTGHGCYGNRITVKHEGGKQRVCLGRDLYQ